MSNFRLARFILLLLCAATPLLDLSGQTPPVEASKTPAVTSGKTPIIIIPGLTGSELVNSKTDEIVWFKAQRSKDDDVRLPISPILSRNRDDLVAKDIIREVKLLKFLPEIEIYQRLVDALETRGGFKEGSWTSPKKDGDRDTFYVFPYDWRRDNVENARLLLTKIESLKQKLGKRNLRFNIIAHSMGGLIARYAAMYGRSDIPAGIPKPTWAGARDLDKIFLLGTPNEGAVSALDGVLNGFSYIGGGLNLPFVQNISRFDLFTIPAIYQLLPHDGTLRAYDENLKPIALDIYDPVTWETYNWGIWRDDDYKNKFTPAEQRNVQAYFRAVLLRAKRFQIALDANTSEKVPVAFYLVGGDCKDTQGGVLLIHNDKKERWETRFSTDAFTNTAGVKITSEQLKPLLTGVGDSVVLKSSLAMEDLIAKGKTKVLPVVSQIYQCEGHTKLVTSADVQDKLFTLLGSGPIP